MIKDIPDWAAHSSPNAILDVLRGNVRRLTSAFIFSDTPEGSDYWYKIYESGVLTPEAKEKLVVMLNISASVKAAEKILK